MSSYLHRFRSYLRKNETAKGLLLVALVILGAIAVWGGIRLALNTEYPILVVSSGSMCQRLTNPNTDACTLAIGDLIVIRGQDPATIHLGEIIVFRPNPTNQPDYLVVHRVFTVFTPTNGSSYPGQYAFYTHGDANPPGPDGWGQVPSSHIVGGYQFTVPIPYLGQAILAIRDFMYNGDTGQPRPQGILVIVALIVALFAFEVMEPGKKSSSSNSIREPRKTEVTSEEPTKPVEGSASSKC